MTTSRSAARVVLAHAAYNLTLLLACLLALLPFLVRAARDRRQLPWLAGKLGALPGAPPAGRPVWIHAVSVGEVRASRPLVARLRAACPDVPLVVSTGTASGHDTARAAYPDLFVFHAPLDLAPVVRRMLRRVRPRLVLLLELEVWPSFLRVADEEGVPQAILNGRVTQRSFQSYRRWSWWVPEFDRLCFVAAQDEEQRARITALGVPAQRVVVTGNLKHDLVREPGASQAERLAAELGLDDGRPVFLAGSTHAGEEEAALAAWERAGGGARCRLVLVPRHLERVGEVERVLRRAGVRWVRRSDRRRAEAPETVLLVDSMGELEPLLARATVVFLGGSLVPVGGHNLLEPAAAGRPLLCGPHLESCRREADLLVAAGALRITRDERELGDALRELLEDEPGRQAMGRAALVAVASLRGAAEADVAALAARGLLGTAGGLDPSTGSATLSGPREPMRTDLEVSAPASPCNGAARS